MKIGFKLTVIMAALGLFAIASVSITLLIRSRANISGLSEKYAVFMANDSAADITNFLQAYMHKAENTANVMEQYRYMMIANRRNFFNFILAGITRENPGIIAAWCVWEPDALEGDDQQFLGTKGTSSGGRFSPYYYWENGNVEQIVLEDFEDPAYLLPKKTGLTTVLDPYEYKVGSKTVLMTSIAVPIRTDGKVVGVIGFDIPLTEIQKISQTQKPFPDSITAVFSNNGTVTAHFDESRIGKNLRVTEADMAGKYLNDFMNAITAGKPYSFSNYIEALHENMTIFTVPIPVGAATTPWSYAIAVMRHTIMS